MTWHADPSTDPAPASIVVQESASSSADAKTQFGPEEGDPMQMSGTISGSDGLSGQSVKGSFSDSRSGNWQHPPGEVSDSVADTVYQTLQVSGGSVSFTRTLKCSSDADEHSAPTASGSVSYSVSVHAQPYNFKRTAFPSSDPPSSVISSPGELQFYYTWLSTDGNLNSLCGIEIHENVDSTATPDDPPFNWLPPTHFDIVALPGSDGALTDTNSYGTQSDQNVNDDFQKPYKVSSFSVSQTFKFYDPSTMAKGQEQSIPGASGPFTITNYVSYDNSASLYYYHVSKDGEDSQKKYLF